MTVPLWSPDYKMAWDDFFNRTNPNNLPSLRNLDHITQLATHLISGLHIVNPCSEQYLVTRRQWHVDQLSLIKQRLAHAIDQKRNYYDKTIWGRITKFVLKLFRLWNNGNTACIRRAEELLLKYDTRCPVAMREGRMCKVLFSLGEQENTIDPAWIRNHLQVGNFYNYDPNRAIEVLGGDNETMPRFMVAVRPIS